MSDVVQFWQEVHLCFDPMQPVAIDRPELHVARDPEYNPITEIEGQVALPTHVRSRFLLTGAVGNGKSSEINHVAGRLAQHRIVVLFDVHTHLQNLVRDPKAIDRLQMWELLGLIGLAVFRAGTERFGHKWSDEPEALRKALATLREDDATGGAAEIDLVTLARGMSVAAGGVVGGALGAAVGDAAAKAGTAVVKAVADATEWTWKIGLFDSKRRGDQEGEVQAVLNAVNRLITSLQADLGRPLLVIFDGLDRITDGERIAALFVESRLLGELACDLLFPVALEHMRLYGQRVDPFEVRDLFNVPVLDRANPSQPGAGIEFFRELVAHRFAFIRRDLAARGLSCPDDPLPQPQLDRLAYYSGGIAREFVTMIRGVAVEAMSTQRERIDDDIVERVLNRARRQKEFYIDTDQIAVLETVMRDPQRKLPGGPLALALIHERRLLAYPNERTWFYPHPLLTMVLLRPRAGSPD